MSCPLATPTSSNTEQSGPQTRIWLSYHHESWKHFTAQIPGALIVDYTPQTQTGGRVVIYFRSNKSEVKECKWVWFQRRWGTRSLLQSFQIIFLDLLFKDKWMKGRLWHLLSKRHMFGESTHTALNKTGSENVKNVMPRLTVDRSFQERAAVCVCVCCYISAQFHLYKITRWKTFLNSLEFFSRHDCSCRLTSKIQLFSPPSGHPGWSVF